MAQETPKGGRLVDRDPTVRAAIVGCGRAGRSRIRLMLTEFCNTHVTVVCEPSPEAYSETAELFKANRRAVPPNEPDLARLLDQYSNEIDVAFIVTPHALHCRQAKACLEAGLDVLVEKPMVMTAAEANDLIETRDRTGRLLVVAFQGSLSPYIRGAADMLRSGELGPIRTISGVIWQDWAGKFAGEWRQQPEVSGGGFVFDSGAHMLNTVADLAGEEFTDVWALFDNHGGPVEVTAVVMGRLKSGMLVTINACGDTAPSCASDIRVFCAKGALRTGAWGETLEVLRQMPADWQTTGNGSRDQGWEKVEVPESRGVWEEFLATRGGSISNPSPPELGLRMAHLWDAIKESAAQNGAPVRMGA